jgi:hypothetical protein
MNVTVNLNCKWTIKDNENYVFSDEPKLLININTGKVVNQIIKSNCIGYNINGKFYSLTKLKTMLTKIK